MSKEMASSKCLKRDVKPLYLVDLFSDGCSNNPGIKCTYVDSNKRSKRFWSPKWFYHIPEERLFPFCVDIICIFPP